MDNIQDLINLINDFNKPNISILAVLAFWVIASSLFLLSFVLKYKKPVTKYAMLCVSFICFGLTYTYYPKMQTRSELEAQVREICERIYVDISTRKVRWYHPNAVTVTTRYCDKERLVTLLDDVDRELRKASQ